MLFSSDMDSNEMRAIDAEHYLLYAELKRDKVPSFDEFPFSIPVVRNLERLEFHPAVTFLVGENGAGKSTLLEAIAIAWGFNPEGGSKNFNFATRETHSPLSQYLRLGKGIKRPKDGYFLRAESFYNVASQIDSLDESPGGPPIKSSYGGKSLHNQSHGESFFALLMERFRGKGLYLLDEPEAALSPTRQMAMLTRMHDLIADKSQFIIATHSPIIMAYPNSQILLVDSDGLKPINYTDTEHYLVTRDFLNRHEKFLKELTE